jgi:hypothetical protein
MSNFLSDLSSNKKVMWVFGIGIIVILLLGFGVILLFWNMVSQQGKPVVATLDPALFHTQAVQTIQAELTLQAAEAFVIPTETPSPELVETQTPSPTPVQESGQLTPTPIPATATMIVPSLTPVPVVCNSAQFIRDVTVIDDTPFAPDTLFVKTWRLRNTGNCTWTRDYSLVLVSGNPMDSKRVVSLPHKVEPNQTIDISVSMKSPSSLGSYRGDWMLSTPSGERFGTGSRGTETIYVSIKVMRLSSPGLVYDFAANYCKAQWQSGFGKLPCPGTSSGNEGFVTLLDMPKLEYRQEDELTLWTHPQSDQKGWISGMYPEFTIKNGHRFIAWVGCLADSKGCNVNFRLDFLNTKSGSVKNLGVWHEVYDGKVTVIDLDLSQHAGKNVKFIFTVEVAGGNPARANAFWFVPGIVQAPTPTPTGTSTPTPTETSTPTPTETSTPTPTETPTPTPTETPAENP